MSKTSLLICGGTVPSIFTPEIFAQLRKAEDSIVLTFAGMLSSFAEVPSSDSPSMADPLNALELIYSSFAGSTKDFKLEQAFSIQLSFSS